MSIRWSCAFSYSSITLAICYGLLLMIILTFLARLAWRTKWIQRRPQKVFLLAVAIQSCGRIIYFIWWPYKHDRPEDPCSPGTDDDNTEHLEIDILGTGPPLLFLIAFSVNVHTFARIYHNVLIPALYPPDTSTTTNTTTTHTDTHQVTVQPITVTSTRSTRSSSTISTGSPHAGASTTSTSPPALSLHTNRSRHIRSQIQWRLFQLTLFIVNAIVCTLVILSWFLRGHPQSIVAYAEIWALSIAVFFIAAAFFVYACLLYYGIRSKLERGPTPTSTSTSTDTTLPSVAADKAPIFSYNSAYRDHGETLYDPFLGVLHQISLHDETTIAAAGSSPGDASSPIATSTLPRSVTPPTMIPNEERVESRFEDEVVLPLHDDLDEQGEIRPKNPMRKLVIVAFICLACFCVRTILLPVLTEFSGGVYSWYNILLYFCFSELIPMILMLHIFDLSAPARTTTQQTATTSVEHEKDQHIYGGMDSYGWSVEPHYYGYHQDEEDVMYGEGYTYPTAVPTPPPYSRLPSSHAHLISPVAPVSAATLSEYGSYNTPPSSLARSSSQQSYSDSFRQTLRNALH